MWLLLIAALSSAGGEIASKYILSRQKLSEKNFNLGIFLFLVLFSGIFAYWLIPFWQNIIDINLLMINWRAIAIFALMIAAAVVWNIFYALGLKRDSMDCVEPFIMFVPILTVIFSLIFLPEERSLRAGIVGIVAGLALFLSFMKKGHLKFYQGDKWLALAMGLMAFEYILNKMMLDYLPAAWLYFIRSLIIFIVFLLMYRKFNLTNNQGGSALGWLAGAGLLGAIYKIIQFTSFSRLGVITTTIILTLSPFMVLVLDKFWLKEKLHWRKIAAIIVIVSAIIYIQ